MKGGGMTSGERVTGISNSRYDLVSVLYHALHGGWAYDEYIEDAEKEDNQELADFFRGVQQEGAQRVQKAKELLDRRQAIDLAPNPLLSRHPLWALEPRPLERHGCLFSRVRARPERAGSIAAGGEPVSDAWGWAPRVRTA
jgi:hypothetical protein